MTDREALIRGILEAPDDDAPRLVFADWLEETGEPAHIARAEFIRVQCASAASNVDKLTVMDCLARVRSLLLQYEAEWRRELPRLQGIRYQQFRRGFVNDVVVESWTYFRRHSEAMFSTTPIQALRLGAISYDTCRWLLDSPHIEQIRELDLPGRGVSNQVAQMIAVCPRLGKLTHLALRGGSRYPLLTDRGLQMLAASSCLTNLVHLDLRYRHITDTMQRILRERFAWVQFV